jgi:type IV secretion system protein TrbI
MADPTPSHGTAPVRDRRIPPLGVMPRRIQTWLMMGLAAAVLAIIAFTGQPAPAPGPTPKTAGVPVAPSPDRLQEYQARLRAMDERARAAQEEIRAPAATTAVAPAVSGTSPAPAADPIQEERRRREYESLFAPNLVMSRRPEAQQFIADRRLASRPSARTSDRDHGTPPTLDEVAEAVVRATSRSDAPPAVNTEPTTEHADATGRATAEPARSVRPVSTGPISSVGPLHRLLEGTLIETVLTHRVEGSAAAPVNCLVTSPVYSHDGQYVLIPAGSRVLGETRPVQSFGETRLAVAFNRLVFPDGSSRRLDQFAALNDIGETGLRDQVNQHYRSTFGASAAVGLLTGFAQYLGSRGVAAGDGDRTVVIGGNVGDATTQATAQTMNRFLNRLPTVTIREGHRVKVYVTADIELTAYGVRQPMAGALVAAQR